jgi:hypothetical protein
MNSLSQIALDDVNSAKIQDAECIMRFVYIEEYSPKSFVVRDETNEYEHREALEKLGGKWNRFLREKETGVVFAGWIFYNGKRTQVDEWLKNILQK